LGVAVSLAFGTVAGTLTAQADDRPRSKESSERDADEAGEKDDDEESEDDMPEGDRPAENESAESNADQDAETHVIAHSNDEAMTPVTDADTVGAAFNAPTTVEFENTPLRQAVQLLLEPGRVRYVLDEVAMSRNGVYADASVKMEIEQATLREAFQQLLQSHNLKAVFNDGVLLIEPGEGSLEIPDAPTVSRASARSDDSSSSEEEAEPAGEQPSDEPGEGQQQADEAQPEEAPSEEAQSEEADPEHGQEREVVSAMREPVDDSGVLSRNEWNILRKLEQPVPISFSGAPMADAVRKLASECGIPIFIRISDIEDASMSMDQTVDFEESNIPLSSFLNEALGAHGMGYVVRNNLLIITTMEKADSPDQMAVRVYPISDLLAAGNESPVPLIDLIQTTIGPETWQDTGGGNATIRYYAQSLVVLQSESRHREISRLLNTLHRQAASPEVAADPSLGYDAVTQDGRFAPGAATGGSHCIPVITTPPANPAPSSQGSPPANSPDSTSTRNGSGLKRGIRIADKRSNTFSSIREATEKRHSDNNH
jgi:hypothetical protein